MGPLEELVRVASGDTPADLLIRNGKVVDVFSGDIEERNVAVYGGRIAGFGDYEARAVLDVKGAFLCPGLIDGHVHVESSMVTVPEFATAVVPHGTTSAVIDPHEIANVLGSDGVRFMADSADGVPLNVFVMVSSCVPATHMETSGAVLKASDIRSLLKEPWAIGLAEVMNFPGVIAGDADVMKKIEAAQGMRIDGHAPMVSGKQLHAYVAAGIRSDHECTTAPEAKEKLKDGMWIMVREGSAARNLRDLLPLVTSKNSRRFFFVTDDRHPKELLEEGHIDAIVREAIRLGLDPILAIQMATLNAAEYFGITDLGAIAPGYRADLVSFDHLSRFKIGCVFKDGVLVAENGEMVFRGAERRRKGKLFGSGSIRTGSIAAKDLIVASDRAMAKIIDLVPNQIITKKALLPLPLENGIARPDVSADLLKIAVVERHHGTGNVGIGFVRGFGLEEGALGSSVAHDSHNLVIVGTNDRDMLTAIRRLRKIGGGLVAVAHGQVSGELPLPVAGLMSGGSVHQVYEELKALHLCAERMGCRLPDPFMTLSFLALPVIPELKLTDKGLVDVTQFKIVPLFEED
jgi:adenine deaminase